MGRSGDNDCTMTWESMWSYFSSSFCTDEMRLHTLKSLNLEDALDGKPGWVQFEILEHAPEEILNNPSIRRVVRPDVLSSLAVEELQQGPQYSIQELWAMGRNKYGKR